MSREKKRESFVHAAVGAIVGAIVRIVVTVAVLLVLILGVVWIVGGRGPDVPKHSWLVLDLYGTLHEYAPPGGVLAKLTGGGGVTLQDMLDDLDKAAVDKRIDGVLFKLSSSNDAGWAKLEELHDAVGRVRAAGKKVYAWGDMLDLRTLYLASACDTIAMPAGGEFDLRGLAVEAQHVRGALDKLGIVPHFHKIKDYKAAAELVMDKKMSDAARENREWLLDEVWEQVVPAVAEARGMDADRVEELMRYAMFQPQEAADAGLIDTVMYFQDLEDLLKDPDDEALPTVDAADYAKVEANKVLDAGGGEVAVVHAQGMIGGRESRVDPLLGVMMGHESVVAELRRCRRDDKVKAVVFRVDSRGGESLASDLIAHEVELTAKVKPVVVSMVDVAASGGYMISYKATRIMADPLTITGSIGSISGFMDMKGFLDKIGVTYDSVSRGPMAELGSWLREPTPAEWDRFVDAHWKGFDAWLDDVAAKRGMSIDDVTRLAYGRVWSGRQAEGDGLIDATGDLHDAVVAAAELAKLTRGERPKIVHYPEKKGLLGSLLSGNPHEASAAVKSAVWNMLRGDVSSSARALETAVAMDAD